MRPIDELREKIDLWKKSTTDTALMSVLHDVLKQIDAAIYEMDHQEAESPWHRVEEGLPDDEVPVLAMLHNTYGRNVVLKLCHIGHHKRTTEDYGWQEYEGETEYDEENDCFWIPEGWWESNYHEDNVNWEIDETDGTITHWMPLPEPPKEDA